MKCETLWAAATAAAGITSRGTGTARRSGTGTEEPPGPGATAMVMALLRGDLHWPLTDPVDEEMIINIQSASGKI